MRSRQVRANIRARTGLSSRQTVVPGGQSHVVGSGGETGPRLKRQTLKRTALFPRNVKKKKSFLDETSIASRVTSTEESEKIEKRVFFLIAFRGKTLLNLNRN